METGRAAGAGQEGAAVVEEATMRGEERRWLTFFGSVSGIN
jgi:hypothetical protein